VIYDNWCRRLTQRLYGDLLFLGLAIVTAYFAGIGYLVWFVVREVKEEINFRDRLWWQLERRIRKISWVGGARKYQNRSRHWRAHRHRRNFGLVFPPGSFPEAKTYSSRVRFHTWLSRFSS
jgi:hypothetical protein